MTGRKRVWAALQGCPLDHPPKGELLITEEIIKGFPCPDLQAVLAYLNTDLVVLPITQPDLLPSTWRTWAGSGFFLFGLLQGPLTYLSFKLGWHGLSYLLVKKPGEAREIMRKYLEGSVQAAAAALAAGCEGILIADDLAGHRGPLISPSTLEALYFPLLADLLQDIGCRDVPCLFHSDGYMLKLLPLLKEVGFRGIHGLQPSVGIGPDCFRRQDLRDWTFWGNFEFEGPDGLKRLNEVENEVVHLLREWADFPGYIFGSSGGLYQGLSPEVIKAAYDVVTAWRYEKDE